MKKIIPLFLCLLFSASFISCNDGDDNGRKTVEVKVTGSANADIISVIVTFPDGSFESFTDIDENPWSRFFTYDLTLSAAAMASTTDGKSGQLTLQIIRDGRVVKENKASGTTLGVNATY